MPSRLLVLTGAMLLVIPASAQDADWQSQAINRAIEYHAANRPGFCVPPDTSFMDPASFELQVGEDTAARQALIVEFPCQIGATSQTSVYLLSDQRGTVSEIVFPSPKFDIVYQGEGQTGPVDRFVLYETPYLREVANAQYESSSRTMSERKEMQELGGADTETRWQYKNGKFEITYFAVDAPSDGERGPIVLIEREIW